MDKIIAKMIQEMTGGKKGKFARLVGVDPGTITRWLKTPGEKGHRFPSGDGIGKLIRVARPEFQARILETIGAADDVMQFARELLESAGITVIDAQALAQGE